MFFTNVGSNNPFDAYVMFEDLPRRYFAFGEVKDCIGIPFHLRPL